MIQLPDQDQIESIVVAAVERINASANPNLGEVSTIICRDGAYAHIHTQQDPDIKGVYHIEATGVFCISVDKKLGIRRIRPDEYLELKDQHKMTIIDEPTR